MTDSPPNSIQATDWIVAQLEYEGNPMLTRVRRNVDAIRSSGHYPLRVEMRWLYQPDGKKMPSAGEESQIEEVLGALADAAEKARIALLIAIHVGAGEADWVFYIKDIETFAPVMNRILSRYPQLPIQVLATEDPEWTDYAEMMVRIR